jgi:folate-dependent phosphoribosylglycinamide formyltransferase PurN
MRKRSLRWLIGRSMDAAAWRPSHALYVRDQLVHLRRNEHAGYSDHDHLVAAANWLARAQDVTGNGGVSGRYSLRTGWTSSYPETTGYIIPTFLSLAREVDPAFHARAARCVEFLKPLQLPGGAFPAGELHENRASPSVFNTAQILHGLLAWHSQTGDVDAAEAATRAASWLASQQHADGSWRTNLYNGVTTYTTHASCWLAQAGRHFGVDQWTRAAERHLDWALSHVDSDTGWINRAGFGEEDHQNRRAVVHTLAYTIWGLLDLSQSLEREDALSVARRAAERVARRLELTGSLPGELDSQWKASRSDYACLTGNAQMALIWFRLAKIDGDARFINTAIKAVDLVKAAQAMNSGDTGIRGGIPGSAPVWGDYIYMALPNWAAKYFIDALRAKRDALLWADRHSEKRWVVPPEVSRAVPAVSQRTTSPVRVVMLSTPDSHKIAQMTKAWASWNFRPLAVVLEHQNEPGFFTRIARRLRADGFTKPVRNAVIQRLRKTAVAGSEETVSTDVAAYCEAEGIPIIRVRSLSLPEAVAVIRGLAPDVLVHAGAGILRRELLSTPRLGTLNAHMGILPRYRGMNVSEWARLEGNPVGCTVHLVNAGIDTGDIVAVHEVDTASARSVLALREIVDEAQITLLGQVLRFVVETGSLPRTRPQAPEEGRQYFRMHPDLQAVLHAKLMVGREEQVMREPQRALQTLAALSAT